MIEVCSRLAIDRERLWSVIITMEGVNAELAPWLRMSVPLEARGKSLADVRLGEVAFNTDPPASREAAAQGPAGRPSLDLRFKSWLLALGFLPFDLHRLCLIELEPGHRFLERSSSWLQRVWQHERTLEAVDGGTQLCDRVTFEPRIGVLTPVVRAVVARLFRHRHARLRARFGVLP